MGKKNSLTDKNVHEFVYFREMLEILAQVIKWLHNCKLFDVPYYNFCFCGLYGYI